MSDQAKATLVIDGDTEQIAKKGGDALEKVGQKGGESFEKAIGKLARGIIIAKAIGDALKAGADEYKRIIDESKQIGESAIKSRLGQAQTAARLGLGGSIMGTIAAASGSTTEEQRASFAAGLSADNGKDINRKAINLQATGLFTDAEISSAIKEGRLDELEKGKAKRRSQLGPDYEKAVRLEDAKRNQDALKREAVAGQDFGPSAAQRAQEIARLENPIAASIRPAIQAAAEKIPGIGSLAGATVDAVGGATESLMFKMLAANEETAANTRRTPNYSANANGPGE